MTDRPDPLAEAVGDAGASQQVSQDEWFTELRRQLVRAVRHVCPRWLVDQADDIVQAATMRLLEREKKGGEIRDLGPSYLRKVAYSAAVDEIRRHYRRQEVNVGDGPIMEMSPSGLPGPEAETRAREIDRGLSDCLARLVTPRHVAVTLHLQGYGMVEAARSLGWTSKRVEHLIYRGMADLRECLSRKGLKP